MITSFTIAVTAVALTEWKKLGGNGKNTTHHQKDKVKDKDTGKRYGSMQRKASKAKKKASRPVAVASSHFVAGDILFDPTKTRASTANNNGNNNNNGNGSVGLPNDAQTHHKARRRSSFSSVMSALGSETKRLSCMKKRREKQTKHHQEGKDEDRGICNGNGNVDNDNNNNKKKKKKKKKTPTKDKDKDKGKKKTEENKPRIPENEGVSCSSSCCSSSTAELPQDARVPNQPPTFVVSDPHGLVFHDKDRDKEKDRDEHETKNKNKSKSKKKKEKKKKKKTPKKKDGKRTQQGTNEKTGPPEEASACESHKHSCSHSCSHSQRRLPSDPSSLGLDGAVSPADLVRRLRSIRSIHSTMSGSLALHSHHEGSLSVSRTDSRTGHGYNYGNYGYNHSGTESRSSCSSSWDSSTQSTTSHHSLENRENHNLFPVATKEGTSEGTSQGTSSLSSFRSHQQPLQMSQSSLQSSLFSSPPPLRFRRATRRSSLGSKSSATRMTVCSTIEETFSHGQEERLPRPGSRRSLTPPRRRRFSHPQQQQQQHQQQQHQQRHQHQQHPSYSVQRRGSLTPPRKSRELSWRDHERKAATHSPGCSSTSAETLSQPSLRSRTPPRRLSARY